jgi:hypothetical protein
VNITNVIRYTFLMFLELGYRTVIQCARIRNVIIEHLQIIFPEIKKTEVN